MKKSLLLASMAALSLSAVAQGVDPSTYEAKNGLQLTNKWLMNVGDGTNGVGTEGWTALTQIMANPGKATMATMIDGKIYISCSQGWVPMVDENGNAYNGLEHNGHLIVLDAETGAYIKDLPLTIDGAQYYDLLCANMVGHDEAGNLWVAGYVGTIFNADTNASKAMNLYLVDKETGAMTLVNGFEIGSDEGPQAGARVDYYDVAGDLTNDEVGAVFVAIPNETAAYLAWVKYAGADEWDAGDEGYLVIEAKDTYPAGQTAWNYSPLGSIVRTGEAIDASPMVWVDGHTTNPALYDGTGELLTSHASHAGDAASADSEGGPWADFLPDRQANGMVQFTFMDEQYLVYALKFPDDSKVGGNMAIVKLDQNGTLEEATPLWVAPSYAGKLGIRKGEGRFSHAFAVSDEYTDANGKHGIDIMLYKDMNGVGVYTLAEEGFQGKGVNDIVIDNTNAPVEYFNLNGVRVAGELTPGFYITRQGTAVSKVVVK